ncbi:MAG TPA: TRAP transporter small permease subunit [Campylobacterales bacterium]|nr:TRAP transporter small permease subunit [Campylobacterales bacterium]
MIEKLLDKLASITSYFLYLLVALIIYDLTNRYLFSSGSIALQELEWHIFDFIMLFSLYFTLKLDGHVRVDIFYSKFSEKFQRYIDIFAHLFFIIPFSVLVIYTSFDFVTISYLQHETSSDPGGLPYRFVVKSFVIFGFGLLILQSIIRLKNTIQR